MPFVTTLIGTKVIIIFIQKFSEIARKIFATQI